MEDKSKMVWEDICQAVESNKNEVFQLSTYIYENPEIAFEEEKACHVLCESLEKHGFEVARGAGGLKTAFTAVSCPSGQDGVHIDILGEYDALGLGDSYGKEYTVAHACGHNIIAATAVGAGAALKKIMEKYQIPGILRVVGTPAEEGGGGKIIMQEAGVFEGIDALLMVHPTSGKTKIAGRCKCGFSFKVTYRGLSAHAGNHKERGFNAQDAANICYTSVGCLRYQLPDDVQVFCLFTSCSEDRAIIPDVMKMTISIRCFSVSHLETAIGKVRNCIEAGALAAGCRVEIQECRGTLGRVVNHTLEQVLRKHVNLLGEPLMDGMVDDNGGEDFGNLNRKIPGIMLYPSLLPEKKISNHTLEFYNLCNSDRAREMILLGSKALACTAMELFENSGIIKNAKEELKQVLAAELQK